MDKPAALFDLSGRIACVTGASAGLGQHTARVLAAAGAKVVGVARRAEAFAAWQAEMDENAAVVAADLLDRAALKDIAAQIAEPFGAPDIIVHAAGINTREEAHAVSDEGWDVTMNLNLAAPMFLSQALVPAMQAKGWGGS